MQLNLQIDEQNMSLIDSESDLPESLKDKITTQENSITLKYNNEIESFDKGLLANRNINTNNSWVIHPVLKY